MKAAVTAACALSCLLAGCAMPDRVAEHQRAEGVQMAERYNAYQASRKASVERYVDAHPELPVEVKAAILGHHIILGMSEADVLASSGDPAERHQSVNAAGVNEMWVYGKNFCVFFQNGLLVCWTADSSAH